MSDKVINIGGASGYWGDAALSTPQLLRANLHYLVYDYLAEITMSILARARAKDPQAGYATDFVNSAMAPHLGIIAQRGIKVVSNAGGVNPQACAAALRRLIRESGLNLRVAVVEGDDLIERRLEMSELAPREMFSGAPFPPADAIASINAYLGAFPIALALRSGADIVITGRCVDSAVTLGPCIYEFGWNATEYNRLAGGSLAGHILECGTQATGGNFTDWTTVVDSLADAGYPIAEIRADGACTLTKPANTGGVVSVGTVGEQLLYEIGDPCAYLLPDVSCDFSAVTLSQVGKNRVEVTGARGRPPPRTYKVSATFQDGYRGGEQWVVYGRNAELKARKLAQISLDRARESLRKQELEDFVETCVEIIGAESQYGSARVEREYREVHLKVAARHPKAAGITTLFKEFVGSGLAAPPGLAGFAGGRPTASPVVRLFSFPLAKDAISVRVRAEGDAIQRVPPEASEPVSVADAVPLPEAAQFDGPRVTVPLERLAWARSGDKGDRANIGVIARRRDYMPYIWASLTEREIAQRFAHFLKGRVERFYLPGLPAINFLLHDVLGGGGVASLRSDPQGKGYAQLLLEAPISLPAALLEGAA